MSKSSLSAIFGDSSGSDSDSDDDSSNTGGSNASSVPAVNHKTTTAGLPVPSAAGATSSIASLIFSDDSDDSDSDDENDQGGPGAGMSNLKPSTSRAGRAKALAKQRKRGGGTGAAASVSAVVDSGDSYDEEESDSSGDEYDKAFIEEDKEDRHGNSESRYFKGKDERPDRDRENRKKRGSGRSNKSENSLDRAVYRLKPAKRKTDLKEDVIMLQAQEFVKKMNSAANKDDRAVNNGKLPMHKLGMLKEVENMMLKRGMRNYLIQANICEAIVKWLKWGKAGSLPTLAIRSKLFRLVEPYTIDEEHLKTSRIGKMFNFYSKHPEENSKNKTLLRRLIEKWANENVLRGRPRPVNQNASVVGSGAGDDGNADGSDAAPAEGSAVAAIGEESAKAVVHSASAVAISKARKRTRLDLDRNRDKKKRKKTEPILSGNQYARSIPEALSYDYDISKVAKNPVECDLVVRSGSGDKKRDVHVSKKTELKKMFGNSGTGKASRAVNMSITGRD